MPTSLRAILCMARENSHYIDISTVNGGMFYVAFEKAGSTRNIDSRTFDDIEQLTAWLAEKVNE